MDKPKYSNDYRDWYERAKHDIDAVDLLFNNDGYTDTICYLVQQSVEKYLKGFLLFHKSDYPFIHDLIKLLRLCSKFDEHIIDYLDECKSINSYYIEDRYPFNTPWDYSRDEVKEVLEKGKSVIKYILENSR